MSLERKTGVSADFPSDALLVYSLLTVRHDIDCMQSLSIKYLVFGLYCVLRTYGGLHLRETTVCSVGVSVISIRNSGQAAVQHFGFRQVIPRYE